LTHSGRLTHEVVTRQPWIRRRSGKVRQLQTNVLTTEPRRQLTTSRALTICLVNVFYLYYQVWRVKRWWSYPVAPGKKIENVGRGTRPERSARNILSCPPLFLAPQ